MEGHCQCGQIRFTTPLPQPYKLLVCHCTECRHQSSSCYGMTAIFPFFKITPPFEGAIAVCSRPNPNGFTNGDFCTKCGSRLVHEHVDKQGRVSKSISVKSGCLDGITKEMMRKAEHVWTRSPVVDVPEGVEQYAEEPEGGRFATAE